MTTVGLSEAKGRLSELVARAARGEEIVITRRGEPVAHLMPPERLPLNLLNRRRHACAVAERIRRSRVGHPLGDTMSIRQGIEEGRC